MEPRGVYTLIEGFWWEGRAWYDCDHWRYKKIPVTGSLTYSGQMFTVDRKRYLYLSIGGSNLINLTLCSPLKVNEFLVNRLTVKIWDLWRLTGSVVLPVLVLVALIKKWSVSFPPPFYTCQKLLFTFLSLSQIEAQSLSFFKRLSCSRSNNKTSLKALRQLSFLCFSLEGHIRLSESSVSQVSLLLQTSFPGSFPLPVCLGWGDEIPWERGCLKA